jgi:hypothetical protein
MREHFLADARFAEDQNRQPLAGDTQRDFRVVRDTRVAAAQEAA